MSFVSDDRIEPAVDLTHSESNDDEAPTLICSVCHEANGRIVRCTGPCLRPYHIPTASTGCKSCGALDLDVSDGDVIWRHRDTFLCPFCAPPLRDACSHCHSTEEQLTPCSVGGCGHSFCQECRLDPSLTTTFAAGFFICSHHFCSACKSLEPQSENNPLMPCLLCPKAYHLRCMSPRINQETEDRIHVHSEHLQEPSVYSKDVMICDNHKTSLAQYWQNLLQGWKQQWLAALTETPSREGMVMVPWVPPVAMVPEESSQSNSLELPDPEAAFGPQPCCAQEVYGIYTEAVDQSWRHRDHETPAGCFPYDNTPSLVPSSLLEKLKQTLRIAQNNPKIADRLISQPYLHRLKRYRESMRYYLCPLHHRGSYTSFGRHFTKPEVLKQIAQQVTGLLRDNHMLVDMTCGRNSFLPLVKRLCHEKGIQIKGRAYDILTPSCLEDWIRRSWFDVTHQELQPGDELMIGLNPPFGTNGRLAEMFIQRAAEFKPRHIVLITPPATSIPVGYKMVFHDERLCGRNAFSTPTGRDSKNALVPELRLLERTEPPLPIDCRSISSDTRHSVDHVMTEKPYWQTPLVPCTSQAEPFQFRTMGWRPSSEGEMRSGNSWMPHRRRQAHATERRQFHKAGLGRWRRHRERWNHPSGPPRANTSSAVHRSGQNHLSGWRRWESRPDVSRRQPAEEPPPMGPPYKIHRQNDWRENSIPSNAVERDTTFWRTAERRTPERAPHEMFAPHTASHHTPPLRYPDGATDVSLLDRGPFGSFSQPSPERVPSWTAPYPEPQLSRNWPQYHSDSQARVVEEIPPPAGVLDVPSSPFPFPTRQHRNPLTLGIRTDSAQSGDPFRFPAVQGQPLMNPRSLTHQGRPITLHVGPVHQTLNIHVQPGLQPPRKRKLQMISALLRNVEDLMDDSPDDPFR